MRQIKVTFEHNATSIVFRQYLREMLRSKGLHVEDRVDAFVVGLTEEELLELEEERQEFKTQQNRGLSPSRGYVA